MIFGNLNISGDFNLDDDLKPNMDTNNDVSPAESETGSELED